MSLLEIRSEKREGAPQQEASVTPIRLVIRCLAERKSDYWQAFSLEFGLAVQADTLPDAKQRLESMIASYVTDALVGEDRADAADLLCRKATWDVYLKYHIASSRKALGQIWGASKDSILFNEPMPLQPVCAV